MRRVLTIASESAEHGIQIYFQLSTFENCLLRNFKTLILQWLIILNRSILLPYERRDIPGY
jgi:hypothetical protein